MTFKCLLKTARNLDGSIFIGRALEIQYSVGFDKGAVAEDKSLLLVKTFFDNVEDAFLAKKGYLLDVSYKVDLVVKFQKQTKKKEDGSILTLNRKAIGIQVKSSVTGAQEHEKLRNSREEWEFGFPECVVLGKGTSMVHQLHKALRKKPNKRYFDALALAKALAGRTVQKGVPGVEDLVTLGLAVPTKHGYVVNAR